MLPTGARGNPKECALLGLVTRLAQYCIGPGKPILPLLAGRFLQLLSGLFAVCSEERRDTVGDFVAHCSETLIAASKCKFQSVQSLVEPH